MLTCNLYFIFFRFIYLWNTSIYTITPQKPCAHKQTNSHTHRHILINKLYVHYAHALLKCLAVLTWVKKTSPTPHKKEKKQGKRINFSYVNIFFSHGNLYMLTCEKNMLKCEKNVDMLIWNLFMSACTYWCRNARYILYVDMQLIIVNKLHMDTLISHVNITSCMLTLKLHCNIN